MRQLTRRTMMRASAVGLAATGLSGWMPAFANALAADPKRKRHCILLWMTGGPSQMDTFDMKPNHENGGEYKEIATSVPGVRFSEHLPKLAKMAGHIAIVRSLSTSEGDHGRGTYLMRTGHRPGGPIKYPTLGSLISKQLGDQNAELPNYVAVAPTAIFNRDAYKAGFLGPQYSPLTVAGGNRVVPLARQQTVQFAELGVDDLDLGGDVSKAQFEKRLALLKAQQQAFVKTHKTDSPITHKTVYERAVRMMNGKAAKAFDLSDEPEKLRREYGTGEFGQGCLMARRLIEQGVPFVEVTLARAAQGTLGWDTHLGNFPKVKVLSEVLDAGWSSLMRDLKDRGLLESTTILWMGEFGRTPKINNNQGRDHYPKAWTAVLAGGGIKGGQAYGKTSKDGTTVEEGKVDVGDILATTCSALGIDPSTENISTVGRPIKIAEGKPIEQILS